MRALKILAQLALISFGSAFVLAAANVPGYSLDNGRAIGETIGAGLAIFLVAALAAGVTALIAKRSPNAPKIVGGLVAILCVLLGIIGAYSA